MKILLALHGYPPELTGGTEHTVHGLARGLVAGGHQVVVVAGTMVRSTGGEVEVVQGEVDGARVVRLRRPDLYFDHWQKSAHPGVGRAFESILDAERPDVVHVHHWIRLTRDLVARAARRGVPSVVTLHDLWTTCLVSFRVHTATREFCRVPLAASPCLACADGLPPRTPWVDLAGRHMALAQRSADVGRELDLARVVLAPSRVHAEAVERWLGREPGGLAPRAVPPARALDLPRRGPRPRVAGEPLVLASWGNRTPLKGFDLLLEAVRALPDPLAVQVRMAGGGADAAYEARLAELASGLDVQFHPPFGDVAELADHPVADAHVMVSATRAHESWGLVLEEALQLGLPVLLPLAGSFQERAEGRAWASMYAPGDVADLGRAIAELLEDPGRLDAMRAALPARDACLPGAQEVVGAHLAAYGDAVAAGAPEVPPADWWEDRIRGEEVRAWDAGLSGCSSAELGLEEGNP